MTKFLNKYRNESARAQWWNYANDGTYFVTFCTDDRKHLFGEIKDNEMHLSPLGEIVYEEWNISFEMRKELHCDCFVIMPDHIHAILRIQSGGPSGPAGQNGPAVRTHCRASLQESPQSSPPPPTHGVAYRPPKSISSFMAGFKAAATRRINTYRNTPKKPVWQTRFHDHIIRDHAEYQRIYNYIESNIANWGKKKSAKKKKYK